MHNRTHNSKLRPQMSCIHSHYSTLYTAFQSLGSWHKRLTVYLHKYCVREVNHFFGQTAVICKEWHRPTSDMPTQIDPCTSSHQSCCIYIIYCHTTIQSTYTISQNVSKWYCTVYAPYAHHNTLRYTEWQYYFSQESVFVCTTPHYITVTLA